MWAEKKDENKSGGQRCSSQIGGLPLIKEKIRNQIGTARQENETLKSSGPMPNNFFCEVGGKISNERNSRVGQMARGEW